MNTEHKRIIIFLLITFIVTLSSMYLFGNASTIEIIVVAIPMIITWLWMILYLLTLEDLSHDLSQDLIKIENNHKQFNKEIV